MDRRVEKLELKTNKLSVDGFLFLPESNWATSNTGKTVLAAFTHGYTSQKADVISWADRLAIGGVASVIFDLPGHWLGSFRDLPSWESFLEEAPLLFQEGIQQLESHPLVPKDYGFDYIHGGHSLGALLSLHSAERSLGQNQVPRLCIGVGLGISQQKTHLFESGLYQKTLSMRKQLVSPKLAPEHVLPWIRDTKRSLSITNQNIHLICGKDDAVVGPGGVQALAELLENQSNDVTVEEPRTLPHNRPEMAAAFIFSYLKKNVLAAGSS